MYDLIYQALEEKGTKSSCESSQHCLDHSITKDSACYKHYEVRFMDGDEADMDLPAINYDTGLEDVGDNEFALILRPIESSSTRKLTHVSPRWRCDAHGTVHRPPQCPVSTVHSAECDLSVFL